MDDMDEKEKRTVNDSKELFFRYLDNLEHNVQEVRKNIHNTESQIESFRLIHLFARWMQDILTQKESMTYTCPYCWSDMEYDGTRYSCPVCGSYIGRGSLLVGTKKVL